MKAQITLLFLLILLIGGVADLPYTEAAQPEAELVLISITVPALSEVPLLPAKVTVYAHAASRAGTAVIAGTDPSGLAELNNTGLSFRVLEQIHQGADYYLAYPLPGAASAGPDHDVVVLLTEADWQLIRATPTAARSLIAAGITLQAISFDPKPWPPDTAVFRVPAVVDPDPIIQSMMDQVSSSTVYQYDGDLSGMWPVIINGSPYTIATRHTNSGVPIQNATQYVGEHFANLGLAVEYHQWGGSTYPNVIATIPGLSNPDEIYIVSAHLDDMPSGPTAPGADDNASGVVAALIAADILSQYQWDCTIRFGIWTGEEQGLNGSHAYAQRAFNDGDDIAAVLNLDMIAWNTPASVRNIDLHANNSMPSTLDQAQLFADVISAYGLDLIPEIIPNGSGASDHASFWQYGYTAILGIEDFGDFNPYYHTTNDLLSNADLSYFTEFVRASVGSFAHMTGCLVRGGVGYLDGEVMAEGSGDPLAEAVVLMQDSKGGTFTAVTDPTGYYTRTLMADTYTVTAQAEGYLPVTIPGVTIITDTVATQNFVLCAPVDIVNVVTSVDACAVDFEPVYSGTPPIIWEWAFPGGTPATSQSENPQDIDFAISGTYVYSATASSCGGTAIDVYSSEVTVSCESCIPLTAVSLETVSPSPIYAEDMVAFTATLTPEINTLPYTYTVSVEGTAVITGQVSSNLPLAFAHAFADAGVYTVTVSVWNCEAGTAVTDSLAVTVLLAEVQWSVYLPVVLRP